MPHSPEDKKTYPYPVFVAYAGRVEALERALESGEPCLAILQQMPPCAARLMA
ncbi:FrmR: Negative transcriptional regulator of formaldehyde detoxification operon [Salmonella enterica subsp. enterica]|uniref:FrmR: Negative transcriptional regulator of formaldehyde detoxification operon n=1 Tax=Salmonella enterica I TaxID=59201 RepID=A0A379WUN4_SALET|nr:FrmR: Negative transcriptional regulator of formaldehyde detoxification operon [Salmonella enterica subsp. enterica]